MTAAQCSCPPFYTYTTQDTKYTINYPDSTVGKILSTGTCTIPAIINYTIGQNPTITSFTCPTGTTPYASGTISNKIFTGNVTCVLKNNSNPSTPDGNWCDANGNRINTTIIR